MSDQRLAKTGLCEREREREREIKRARTALATHGRNWKDNHFFFASQAYTCMLYVHTHEYFWVVRGLRGTEPVIGVCSTAKAIWGRYEE